MREREDYVRAVMDEKAQRIAVMQLELDARGERIEKEVAQRDAAEARAVQAETERDDALAETWELAARVVDLEAALDSVRPNHKIVEEDCWYSCPLAVDEEGEPECCDDKAVAEGKCNCGADRVNAIIDTALARARVLLDPQKDPR